MRFLLVLRVMRDMPASGQRFEAPSMSPTCAASSSAAGLLVALLWRGGWCGVAAGAALLAVGGAADPTRLP
jgi:hypothetical protein